MSEHDAGLRSPAVSRRRFLVGAAVGGASGLLGCTHSPDGDLTTSSFLPGASVTAEPFTCNSAQGPGRTRLWATAIDRGIVYGSSAATWQLEDAQYRKLFATQAAIVLTEDDLLWWRLRPTPRDELDFTYGDELVRFAEREGIAVMGAHLVWDEGFGEGWSDDDLWGLSSAAAGELLYGTVEETVRHYRGRIGSWIVANEVVDGIGLRMDVPWRSTLGPGYVAESFRVAHQADPDALLFLNDFGFETDDDLALAEDKRAAALALLDDLLAKDVPVHALGVQAHLAANRFEERFDADGYRAFLTDVAERGLDIAITELDVLDDGLPIDIEARDAAVAAAIGTYLDVALDEPALSTLITFGLSDRYTWLQEDYPRDDGAPRRPLPFDESLEPKPAFSALWTSLASARRRTPPFVPPRC